jgi:hypothetical protein
MAQQWEAVLARLGSPTGDGRILVPGGITNRDLPMPLMWQEKTEGGHGGSYTVGTIDRMEYLADRIMGYGTLLDLFPDRDRLMELIDKGVVGPSIDLADDVEFQIDAQERILVTQAGIGGATLVPIEAFSDVSIHLAVATPTEGPMTTPESAPMIVASGAQRPPLDWFKNPQLSGPTALTVTQEGRVYGHVAAWGVCHVGMPGCVTAPSSQTDYAYFMTGAQETQEGVTVPVGALTVGGGHATPEAGYQAAVAHYDDVSTATACVFAGEDEHGIWVAGWVLPGAPEEAVAALTRAPLSGDWRRIGGNLEMIAAHAVNVPGFPIPRAKVKFSGGNQISLVASAEIPEAPVETEPESSVDPSLSVKAAWVKAQWNEKGR